MENKMKYAVIYITLVLLISWSFTLFVFSTPERSKFFVFVMFFPALIAITMNFFRYRSAKLVFKPLTTRIKLKAILFALIYPVLFLIAVSVIVLITRLGTLNTGKLSSLAQFPTLEMLIVGPFLVFGEEYGWRGFLLKEVTEAKGKITGAVVVGIVWALWHAPILYGLSTQANAQNPFVLPLVQMAVVFTLSFPFTYCYFLSNSIVPPMLLHFVWNFYNPLFLGNVYRNQPGIIDGNLIVINGEGLMGLLLGLVCMIWFIRKPLKNQPLLQADEK